MINFKLLEHALMSLMRHKGKHLFIFLIFTMLISVCLVLFTVTAGLKKEAQYSLDNLPDIIVQKITGGRQQYINSAMLDKIVLIPGVLNASDRVWGFYPFDYLNTNLTVVGVDIFDPNMSRTIQEVTDGLDTMSLRSGKSMFIGAQLNEILRAIYNKDEFSFQKPDGEYITLQTAGIFKTESQMISTGTIITDRKTASEILGIPAGMSADIAINAANPQEIATIQEKIENISPSLRVITKEVISASYQNMFDYKGGIFLLFFISSIFTFFVIIFDRLSGISGDEARETAILKAVGWTTGDVLKVRLYESFVISVTAYISAITLSGIYVFILQAPGLKNIFLGYSYLKPHFTIPFTFDPSVYISVFFITVPVYTAAVIIPSWRAASIDSGEVIR
ncbi:protein of unknown function DUF214 [Denitrovibrio acetiphilus DSM 12809]|uniref:ABC3 transporter permease C-terminal domain-containing protein n=1 Tax=Denitrovibrio acetiphilus (strain DSM 12809 / NBRC 114555 / N2460) TaxID=522772 RepID=D4H7D8_DENA2|nr:FtsX-like permease family protein [Denitrovibrio acetiphilus]ADD67937.1 protein of unknown function DUF214 [Denitrovibrio acetiphilus DSM 12809]